MGRVDTNSFARRRFSFPGCRQTPAPQQQALPSGPIEAISCRINDFLISLRSSASPLGFTDSSSDHLDDLSIVSIIKIDRVFWTRP